MIALIRRNTTALFLVGIAIGFALVLVELALINHVRGTQLIAIIACVAGIVLSLVGLVPRRGVRRAVAALFVVLALTGVYGFIEHQQGRSERAGEVAEVASSATDRVVREALDSFASNPPALSPLALSGLSLLGVLTLLGVEAEPAERAVAGTRLRGATD